jgi:hypothetical protein
MRVEQTKDNSIKIGSAADLKIKSLEMVNINPNHTNFI